MYALTAGSGSRSGTSRSSRRGGAVRGDGDGKTRSVLIHTSFPRVSRILVEQRPEGTRNVSLVALPAAAAARCRRSAEISQLVCRTKAPSIIRNAASLRRQHPDKDDGGVYLLPPQWRCCASPCRCCRRHGSDDAHLGCGLPLWDLGCCRRCSCSCESRLCGEPGDCLLRRLCCHVQCGTLSRQLSSGSPSFPSCCTSGFNLTKLTAAAARENPGCPRWLLLLLYQQQQLQDSASW